METPITVRCFFCNLSLSLIAVLTRVLDNERLQNSENYFGIFMGLDRCLPRYRMLCIHFFGY